MVGGKVRIITDSGCDIPPEFERRYNIDIMPFYITLDDKEYIERVDINGERFFKLIAESPTLPKTSQITTARFEDKLIECAKAGCTDAVFVLINRAGSATLDNCVIAAELLGQSGELGDMNVHIIDSKCYSMGYGYIIIEAAKKLEAGADAKTIVHFMRDWFDCVEIYIVGFELRHMKKSGRISAAAAFLGEMMGLRPIISMIDGTTSVVKKSRGDKVVVDDAAKYIYQRYTPNTPWIMVRTTVPDHENAFIKAFAKESGVMPAYDTDSGCVVASNAGPKFFGVIVKGEKRQSVPDRSVPDRQ
jgi:DegV family protein with EDD domain